MHHVTEQDEVVADILKPWDQQVTANGAVADDPLTIYKNYGDLHINSAQATADAIVAALEQKGEAFHGTKAGKEPDQVGVDVDKKAKVYTVRLRSHSGG